MPALRRSSSAANARRLRARTSSAARRLDDALERRAAMRGAEREDVADAPRKRSVGRGSGRRCGRRGRPSSGRSGRSPAPAPAMRGEPRRAARRGRGRSRRCGGRCCSARRAACSRARPPAARRTTVVVASATPPRSRRGRGGTPRGVRSGRGNAARIASAVRASTRGALRSVIAARARCRAARARRRSPAEHADAPSAGRGTERRRGPRGGCQRSAGPRASERSTDARTRRSAIASWTTRTGAAAGPSAANTRRAIPRCTSRTLVADGAQRLAGEIPEGARLVRPHPRWRRPPARARRRPRPGVRSRPRSRPGSRPSTRGAGSTRRPRARSRCP